MNNHKENLIKDMSIIALSVLIAVILVKTEVLINILASSKELELFGSFIAGMFFTSVFTVAPATVVLVEIARLNSLFLVALFGGIGAMIGDIIIFRFVKNRLSEDVLFLLKKSKSERLISIFRLRIFRWLIAFLGALIIASPLPDELGLMMMGFSKIRTSLFIPISFLLNSLGILVIGLIARAIL
ncbi:MAG: hypothetical protein CO003_00255 [Candidatus Portnoybacteria bacterium CG_4_8_14_3_um_filter_44_15]|uniref:TVP38/TMEM64 family membrane protein n=2 Tax=Candidatus Portnoyibacteriota TaxID=1817913 RepID=A0A2H0KTS6_9BACT|nr:MAG: hypothetical protein COV84_00600 [Candidatus Portnoybacteria bacterium CG11_big_fil_rev_8_21_14_0_20_40_15]PIW74886.1 MAG: hypothetical protein CO003_00255 [Candidatus Portnoybacteria bacterium CG_4_8_14_3_um_filter_44_15]